MSDILRQLETAANARGLTVRKLNESHYQITGGPLLVNYYPFSAKRTAYVAGTTAGVENVPPEKAVAMCFRAPTIGALPKDSRGKTTAKKARLYARDPFCRWCGKQFNSPQEATIEHIIPLARGGLDNMNNLALAHEKCNHERGHNMPELKRHQMQQADA
jgi:hypothetical protein